MLWRAWLAPTPSPSLLHCTETGRGGGGGAANGPCPAWEFWAGGGVGLHWRVDEISLVVRASDCQCTCCNGPGFDPSIRRHSGIWGAADETVLNIVRTKRKKSPKKIFKKKKKVTLAGLFGWHKPRLNWADQSGDSFWRTKMVGLLGSSIWGLRRVGQFG